MVAPAGLKSSEMHHVPSDRGAELSLPYPQASASAPASGITPSGRSSPRRPSRKRTDGPGAAPGCRLRPSHIGAGVPPASGLVSLPSPRRGRLAPAPFPGAMPQRWPHTGASPWCTVVQLRHYRGGTGRGCGEREGRRFAGLPGGVLLPLPRHPPAPGYGCTGRSAAREMKCPMPSSTPAPRRSPLPEPLALSGVSPLWGVPSPGCPSCCS